MSEDDIVNIFVYTNTANLQLKNRVIVWPLAKILCFSPCRLQVVLLHGQAFTSKTWEELGTMALLATNGYQALAMDLPGRTYFYCTFLQI